MSYLKKLETKLYDFSVLGEQNEIYPVPDILTKVATYFDEQNFVYLTNDYIIQGNETPEQIAYKLYGNQYLHWTILYINKITNLGEQWPLPDLVLRDIVDNPDQISHYEMGGLVVDESWIIENYGSDYAIPVTNLDKASNENDVKRHIKVIDSSHIGKFVKDFESRLIQ